MITITSNPSVLSSVYNPVVFKATSDSNKTELKFQVKIYTKYVGAGSFTAISQEVVDPLPDGSLEYDASSALVTQLLQSLLIGTHLQVQTLTEGTVEYYCEITELYYDSDGFYAEFDNIDSPTLHATNLIIQGEELFNETDFTMGTDESLFLSTTINNIEIEAGQPLVLNWIESATDSFTPVIEIELPPEIQGIGRMVIGTTFTIK